MFPLRISWDEKAGLNESGQKTSTKTALSSLKEGKLYRHHEDEMTMCRRLPSTRRHGLGEKVDAADRDHTEVTMPLAAAVARSCELTALYLRARFWWLARVDTTSSVRDW